MIYMTNQKFTPNTKTNIKLLNQTTLGLRHLELSKLFLFVKCQNNERQCVRDLVIDVLKIYLNNDGKPR